MSCPSGKPGAGTMANSSAQITLFEKENFQGAQAAVTGDLSDLSKIFFSDRAKSLTVNGDPWVAFTEKDYRGNSYMFAAQEYSILPAGASGKIKSLKVIQGGQQDAKIIVYARNSLNGDASTVQADTPDLEGHGLEGVSSHTVIKGAWELYPKKHFKGDSHLTVFPGETMNTYPDGPVVSLRPCTPVPGTK